MGSRACQEINKHILSQVVLSVMEKVKKKIMTIKQIQSDSSACMPVSPSLLFLAGYQGSPPD